MKYFLFTALCISALQISAQEFEISGKLLDNENNQPLEAATVYVENPADSSLVSYTISERDGDFLVVGKTSVKSLNLFISFTGFQTHLQKVSLEDNSRISLGNILMATQDNALDEVQLTGARAPVTIKQDTLEFNAASFETEVRGPKTEAKNAEN